MARDRFIYFLGSTPDIRIITDDLRGYLSGCGSVELHETDPCRLMATVPGLPEVDRGVAERWFEVFVADGIFDVITRHQDDFVNGIADGFAERIVRKFSGTFDSPDFSEVV